MTRDINDKVDNTWFLDFFTLKHIYNNKELFSDI